MTFAEPPTPSVADDPVVRTSWFPVARVSEVPVNQPVGLRHLDTDLMLWRDNDGTIHAWQDLCIHRGVKLSLGKVCNQQLVCPYHGWTYNTEGQCTKIPAHPDMKPPSKAKVTKYAATQMLDMVWVNLDPEATPAPELEEFTDPDFRTIVCGPYEMEALAPRVVENFLDVGHLPFVHDGIIGDSSQPEIPPYRMEDGPYGPVAHDIRIFQADPDGSGQPAEVTYELGVLSAFSAYFRKRQDEHLLTMVYGTIPLNRTTTKAYMFVRINYGEMREDEMVAFQTNIILQDKPIVESQRPELLPLDMSAELHLPSDRLSIAYRQMLRASGLTFGCH